MKPIKKNGFVHRRGNKEICDAEYAKFKRCFPQLTDPEEMTGDLSGKWVIWKDGWIYGLAAYDSLEKARRFASIIDRDEASPTYIIVQVNLEEHRISPLQMLADAISDAEFLDYPAEDEDAPA